MGCNPATRDVDEELQGGPVVSTSCLPRAGLITHSLDAYPGDGHWRKGTLSIHPGRCCFKAHTRGGKTCYCPGGRAGGNMQTTTHIMAVHFIQVQKAISDWKIPDWKFWQRYLSNKLVFMQKNYQKTTTISYIWRWQVRASSYNSNKSTN